MTYEDKLVLTETFGSRRVLQEENENLSDLLSFSMEEGATLQMPQVSLLSIDKTGFSVKLNKTAGNFTFDELQDQVMVLSSTNSYMIHTSETPLQRLTDFELSVPLDDFGEFQVASDCVEATSFGFADLSLGVGEGKELRFEPFALETEKGECLLEWEYVATLSTGE